MTSTYAPQHEGDTSPIAVQADPSFRRTEQATDDLLDACARLQDLYGGRHFRGRRADEAFVFRYASAGDERLSLRTATFLGHLQGDVPWSKDYVVSWLRSGTATIEHHGGQLTSLGGQPFLIPSETSFSFMMTPHRNNMVHADATFLEDLATEIHGGPSQRIVFDHTATPTPEALVAWRAAVTAATPAVWRSSRGRPSTCPTACGPSGRPASAWRSSTCTHTPISRSPRRTSPGPPACTRARCSRR
jgi:hypothetical protein